MKNILFAILIEMICCTCQAQVLTRDTMPGTSSLKETYLKKSDRKFKAARTLKYVAIGSALTSGVLFIIANNESKRDSDQLLSGLGEGIAGLGFGVVAVGSGLTSILLSASARKYKKASLTLAPVMKLQSVSLPGGIGRRQVAGALVVSF